jgi:hypothetical protein
VANPVKHWTNGAKLGAVGLALFVTWMVIHGSGERSTVSPIVTPAAAALAAPVPLTVTPFSGLDDIEKKVAADAVSQYGIAKRGGAKIDICVHAGFVAAAFMQAKDEANYRIWKATESTDCAAAGMPAP